MALTKLEFYAKRHTALKTERSTFITQWQELAAFTSPRMGRFFVTDVNRGDKRYQQIVNSTATQALRTFRAGLLAGVMSPTRQWFNLMTPDPDMMTYEPVLIWLHQVEVIMNAIFAAGNLYTMAPTLLGELGLFGTGLMTQVDDFDNVARFYTHTAGSFCIAQNDKFIVDTFSRDCQMTVDQLVTRFGLDNVSPTVKNAYDRGNYDDRHDVVQMVMPNNNFIDGARGNRNLKFSGVYYETKCVNMGGLDSKLLQDKGFPSFPGHAPRWDVTGEDVWATDCPGMTSLGDVKGLQALERQGARALDKQIDPPLHGPASLKGIPINSLPGGATIYDASGPQELKPIYTVTPQFREHGEQVQRHEARIKDGYYVNLFRSVNNMEGVQPQNQLYLNMKQSEDMLQLGPVLERIHGEFLNRMIDLTFDQCLRAKILPPPPPELQGQPLRVKYISSLAMAQREVATQTIDKLTMYIGGLMKMGITTAADVFSPDDAVRQYNQALGGSPKLLVDENTVAQVRQEHQKQAQQAQQAQMATQMAGAAQQGAQAVQSLSNAPTQTGGSVLDNLGKAAQPAQLTGPPV